MVFHDWPYLWPLFGRKREHTNAQSMRIGKLLMISSALASSAVARSMFALELPTLIIY